MSRSPLSLGVKILGGGALLLLLFLLVGYVLPADWEAEASAVMPVAEEDIMAFLDTPEGWQEWTPWPEAGVERIGPDRGEGAGLRWSDPELGDGAFTIGATAPGRVEYTVEVSGGSMHADGAVTLTEEGDGVRVTWSESGDLGRNPLMGYWALSMGRAQSEELAKGLERLEALAGEGGGR